MIMREKGRQKVAWRIMRNKRFVPQDKMEKAAVLNEIRRTGLATTGITRKSHAEGADIEFLGPSVIGRVRLERRRSSGRTRTIAQSG
ncbi:hypothetical protein MCOR16_000044 [Pyricularia oryzae]|nr:hypothetical protein MCOR16_000044 [Pyricularia oryzae]